MPPSAEPVMTRTIALMNQKGGVGKTTTTVNLAAGIAQRGRRVLVVDLDPQAHASIHLGIDASMTAETGSVYDVLMDPDADVRGHIREVGENLSVLPAETDLAGVETELAEVEASERTTRLRRGLERVSAGGVEAGSGGGGGGAFEFVLIDCPPSLGVLTLNGLAAAREVFIPMQAHFLALQGVSKLLETVGLVSKSVNPKLRVTGVVLCMHETSTTHAKEVVSDMVSFFDQARQSEHDTPWKTARVLQPPIRRNIKLAECPSFGQTIFDYAPHCPGALDYAALAERVVGEWDELLRRLPQGAGAVSDSAGSGAGVVKTRRGASAPTGVQR